MLRDVVIDTNVLLHASNPTEIRRQYAHRFLVALQDTNTVVCVDEGFDLDERRNRSLIGQEYLEQLRFGMLGYAVVAHLARHGRVRGVSRAVGAATSKTINRLIRDKRDRTFVRVTCNTQERLLTSHDFDDFPNEKRRRLRDVIEVLVATAEDSLRQLQS